MAAGGAGSSLGMGTKVDPRPVTSKQFVADSINELLTFLMEADFQQRISPKVLAGPGSKDFIAIVSFLFRQIDPSFLMTGKMEDDVQLVFRALK